MLAFRKTMKEAKKPVKNIISEAKNTHIANLPCGMPLTGS
jgi:hypothetical protein